MSRAQFTTPFPSGDAGLRPACGLLLTTLLLALALTGCVRRVVVEVPGPPAPCLDKRPPDPSPPPVRVPECPAGLTCLTDDDARAVADEVEARRLWDARAWERCRWP